MTTLDPASLRLAAIVQSSDDAIISQSLDGTIETWNRALEASRVKDEFLATLSHELRTPLNAVLGYTRLLRTGQVAEGRQERAIEVIERNARLLSQLVSDVLDISGIVTGKMRLTIVDANIAALLRAAGESVEPMAQGKGVALQIDTPVDVHYPCDPDRLQQVFWNLLTNAIKFTPAGGQVRVTLSRTAHGTDIAVTDTGVGMRPEIVPHVFERFWQADSVNSRQSGGLGLGLALARHFVELHGGAITASSPGEGEGSMFVVKLPAR